MNFKCNGTFFLSRIEPQNSFQPKGKKIRLSEVNRQTQKDKKLKYRELGNIYQILTEESDKDG